MEYITEQELTKIIQYVINKMLTVNPSFTDNKYFIEEFESEALLIYVKVSQRFSIDKNTKFTTYLIEALINGWKLAIRNYYNKFNMDNTMSLEKENEDGLMLKDVVEDKTEMFIEYDYKNLLFNLIDRFIEDYGLGDKEKKVLTKYTLNKMPQHELGSLVGMTQSTINLWIRDFRAYCSQKLKTDLDIYTGENDIVKRMTKAQREIKNKNAEERKQKIIDRKIRKELKNNIDR